MFIWHYFIKWLMAHSFHEKTDEHSNESLNTHESTDMHMADTKFGISTKTHEGSFPWGCNYYFCHIFCTKACDRECCQKGFGM